MKFCSDLFYFFSGSEKLLDHIMKYGRLNAIKKNEIASSITVNSRRIVLWSENTSALRMFRRNNVFTIPMFNMVIILSYVCLSICL